MVDYLQKILDEFPEEIRTTAPSPAGNHLFQVREGDDDRSLPEDQVVIFHHLVAMLLFMAPRARIGHPNSCGFPDDSGQVSG